MVWVNNACVRLFVCLFSSALQLMVVDGIIENL